MGWRAHMFKAMRVILTISACNICSQIHTLWKKYEKIESTKGAVAFALESSSETEAFETKSRVNLDFFDDDDRSRIRRHAYKYRERLQTIAAQSQRAACHNRGRFWMKSREV